MITGRSKAGISHHKPGDFVVGSIVGSGSASASGIVPSAIGRVLGGIMAGAALIILETLAGRRSRTPSLSLTKNCPSPAGFTRSLRTSCPRVLIIIGAAMLIKPVTIPGRRPLDPPIASMIEACWPPKASDRSFCPELIRDEVAVDAPLGSVTAPITSDALIFEGACETSLNNPLIDVISPALFASAVRRQADDDSRPLAMASLG